MRPHDTHIVIVGNGVAGNSAASAIRSTSKETAITIISQEPFPEYSACTLSKKYLSGEMGRKEVFLKTTEDYSREKIATMFGHQRKEGNSGAREGSVRQVDPLDRWESSGTPSLWSGKEGHLHAEIFS